MNPFWTIPIVIVWLIGLIMTAIRLLEWWGYAENNTDWSRPTLMIAAIVTGMLWPVILIWSPLWGMVLFIHHRTMQRHQRKRNNR